MCINWLKLPLILLTKMSLSIKKTNIYIGFASKANIRREKAQLSKYYKNSYEIPLYNFAKCLCDADYSFLYKVLPKKRIKSAEYEHFLNILAEYNELINEGNLSNYDNIIRFHLLIARIRILEASLTFLEKTPLSVKNILKTIGIRLTGVKERDKLAIEGKRDLLIRECNELTAKLTKLEKESDKTNNIQFFTDAIIKISTFFKIHLDINTVTLSSFCGYYNQLIKELKTIKNGNRKHK